MCVFNICVQALSHQGDSPKATNCQWNAFWLSDDQGFYQHKSSLHIGSDFIPVPDMLRDTAVQTYYYACRAYHVKRYSYNNLKNNFKSLFGRSTP